MAEPSAIPVPSGAPLRLTLRSDARLVRAAAAGDQRAFAAIFERYHQELYRFCRAILGDPHEAQDALQLTMASALRGLPGEERAIELRPWLYRVARNEAISILRRRQSVAEIDDAQLPLQPGSDAVFESRERLRALVADLGALPERQRSALVMRELSGLSYEQIGAALQTSGAAARQVVYEARVALQELEEGRGMRCDEVRKAISDGDGRVLRGRKLRAHLRGCEACTDFRAAIATRRTDLEAVAPPLPALAASGVLASVLGTGAATGGGTLGGLLAGGIGAKSLGLIVASAAIGVGAGTVAGVDLPGLGSDPKPAAESPAAGAGAAADDDGSAGPGAGHQAKGKPATAGERAAKGKRKGYGRGGKNGAPQGAEGSAAGGASALAPAGSGQPDTPPGSSVADERSGGHSAAPSTGRPEGADSGAPAHANVGGASAEQKKLKP